MNNRNLYHRFKDMVLKRSAILFLITLIFFSAILYFYFDGFFAYNGDKVFRDRQYTCFTYLEENTLYNDQAWCFHPPIYYLLTKFIFDLFDENFIFVMIFLALILNIFLFMIIYHIIRKRGNTNLLSFIIPLILYGFVSFIHMVDTILLFSGILFYIVFYLLFYSNNKYKEIISSLLFAVGSLIYSYFFFMCGFLLFVYFISKTFTISFNKFSLSIKFNGIDYLIILKFVLPIIIGVLFFSILFPGFLSYSYLAQISSYGFSGENSEMFGVTTNNLANSVSSLYDFVFQFTPDMVIRWGDLLMIVFFIISVYFLLKRRDLISLTLFLFLVGFILTAGEFYKFALILPFFIILFIEWINEKSLKKIFFVFKWFFIIAIMVLFIYPNLKFIYLTHEFNDMAKEVSYPLSFLPEQEEKILFSSNRLEWYGVDFEYEYYILHPILYDPQGSHILQNYGLVNVSEWFSREYDKQFSFVTSNFNNYNLIMGDVRTPKNNVINNAIKSLSGDGKISGCLVVLASLELENPYGTFEMPVFFKNTEQCDDFGNKAIRYYAENFDSICKKDEFVANTIIKSIFTHNKIGLNKICNNGGSLYYLYSEGKWNLNLDDMRIIYLLIIGISIMLLGFYILHTRYLKIIFLITTIMILSSVVSILLLNYDLSNYRELTNHKITEGLVLHPELFDYGVCYNSLYPEENSSSELIIEGFCRTDEDCQNQPDNLPIKCSYNNPDIKLGIQNK